MGLVVLAQFFNAAVSSVITAAKPTPSIMMELFSTEPLGYGRAEFSQKIRDLVRQYIVLPAKLDPEPP